MNVFEEAAQRRQAGVDARADRPRQRRSGEHGTEARMFAALDNVRLNDAPVDEPLTFSGIASATERGYDMWDWAGPYTEVVSAGAFKDTLSRADLDVPLVLGHDQMRRIARTTNGTLTLAETTDGLDVAATLDRADPDVQYVTPKLRSGLYDEMSFAFRITEGIWSPDYTEYRINAVDLHRGDVSIVGFGANPHTSAGVRSTEPAVRRSVVSSRTLFDVRYGIR